MSSLPCQDQDELYTQITEYLAPAASEPKVHGINRIKVEIAERLVAKFPCLRQESYKDHLLMAIDLKFEELRDEIILHERTRRDAEEETRITLEMLIHMGVVPRPRRDDLPF
jgi:hypothetical protein